jgi:hypothetical protein
MDTTEKQIRDMFCNSGPFDRDEIALLMLQLVERIQNLEQASQCYSLKGVIDVQPIGYHSLQLIFRSQNDIANFKAAHGITGEKE